LKLWKRYIILVTTKKIKIFAMKIFFSKAPTLEKSEGLYLLKGNERMIQISRNNTNELK
jgi:hypothetical protein